MPSNGALCVIIKALNMPVNRNIGLVTARYLIVDLVGDIIYFPLWWYTQGLTKVAQTFYLNLRSTARNLALRLLLLNILKPMFGQYDRAGRIISFFMRLIILVGRLIYFAAYSLLLSLLLILWLGLPILIVYRLLTFLAF